MGFFCLLRFDTAAFCGRTGVDVKKISSYLKEHIWWYSLAVFFLVSSVILDMISPQLTKQIIDDVIGKGEMGKLTGLLIGILMIGLSRAIFLYFRDYIFDINGAQIIRSMRMNLYRHLQGLSADFYERNNTGELMSRVKEDVDRIGEGLTYVGMLLLEVLVHVAAVLFFMFQLDPRLTLVPLAAMVICGFLAIFLERKLDEVYDAISEENAMLTTVAQENLSGVRTVKSFAREKFEIHKFLSHNQRYCELSMKQSRVFLKYHPLFHFMTGLVPLLVLLIGGYQVIQGSYSLGTLGAFVEYSMNIVWPMEMLGWLVNSFSAAVASNRKLRRIYGETATVSDCEDPKVLPQVMGDVQFKEVSFLRGGVQILDHVSFHLLPGRTLGIMGATGSGKSTLIALLLRMHDTTMGEIRLDDVDIRQLKLQQLRGSMSVVTQDVFLFSEAIGHNIKLGKQDELSMHQVRSAAHQAQAGEFIERLDEQYDTVIGERGVGLSGGQKQRVTIARALAGERPILILDDSTSALDMETEQEIQNTLKELTNTAKIIIAHRISAVRHADEILFLEKGRVAERGTHEVLLAAKGLYYQTYMAQYGDMNIVNA
jgi:ATP-binding cassette subfamily B protein